MLGSLRQMELILALDAGTTGVRTVAFDRAAQPVASAYRELTQFFPEPGWVEHDAAEIADLAVATLREVATHAHDHGHKVVAIGITNQRETTVAFDRETGHLAHRAIVWQDRRSAPYCEQLERGGQGGLVRATTGLVLDSYFSATKMKWLLEAGVLDTATSPSLCTIDTWLLWSLSGASDGGVYLTEPSNASRTMLMDLDTLDWSSAMTALFDVPPATLADIRPSTTNFATVSGEVVPELAGVPITGVLGDQQAALFGQACFKPGEAKNTYGTGCFMLMNTGEKIVISSSGLLTTLGYKIGNSPAVYALEGSIAITGALVQWLRDNLGMIKTSSEIESLALSVTDNGGVYFVPAFSGLYAPYWKDSARGVIAGLTRYVNKGHIARAVLESTAFQVREVVDAMEKDSGIKLENLRTDGGMVGNQLLMQFQADILDKPVVRPVVRETTALGAAYAAGLAVGYFKDTGELVDNWAEDYRWNSTMEDATRDHLYHLWKKAVTRTFDWVE